MSGGIYVHIPFCAARCRYCAFVSSTDHSLQKLYVDALTKEIETRGGFQADTVYFGGGTPSILYRGAILQIADLLRKNNAIAPDAEFTVEANPDSADSGFFAECAAANVNRISLGLQTTSDRLLKKLGRIHTYAQFVDAFSAAKRADMRVNVDLMLGIPDQTQDDCIQSLRQVIGLQPDHVSLYALSVEEGTPLCARGFAVDEDLQADMYAACFDLLRKSGYDRYEVSNFARNGMVSRHNLKYWTMQPYLGLGLAAHSFDGRVRRANGSNLSAYIIGNDSFSETVETDDDLREETIMLGLRTAQGLDLNAYRRRFKRDLWHEKHDTIARLLAEKMLISDGERLRLHDDAFYVMNSIIVALL